MPNPQPRLIRARGSGGQLSVSRNNKFHCGENTAGKSPTGSTNNKQTNLPCAIRASIIWKPQLVDEFDVACFSVNDHEEALRSLTRSKGRQRLAEVSCTAHSCRRK